MRTKGTGARLARVLLLPGRFLRAVDAQIVLEERNHKLAPARYPLLHIHRTNGRRGEVHAIDNGRAA